MGKAVVATDVELDSNERSAAERLERGHEAALGEDGGVDATRQLTELFERSRQALGDPADIGAEFLQVWRRLRLGAAQGDQKRDKALLRPVVQVSLDASPRLVGSCDDAR